MTSRAADKTAVIACFCYCLVAILFTVFALRYFMAGRMFFGAAMGLEAVAMAVLGGLWVASCASVVKIDDDGVERVDSSEFKLTWAEVADARIQRIAGWPHLVVTPTTPSKKRTVGQVALGSQGMARDALGAPIALADVDAISRLLARKPWATQA